MLRALVAFWPGLLLANRHLEMQDPIVSILFGFWIVLLVLHRTRQQMLFGSGVLITLLTTRTGVPTTLLYGVLSIAFSFLKEP